MHWTPHRYQEKAIEFLVERREAGLFLDPGLGKTAITLAALKALRSAGFVNKMLVIAPLRPCYSVWPKEVQKWSEFRDFSVGILHGAKKAKVLEEEHDIYVINPEGIRWLFLHLKGKWPFEMLVVDESSKFKSTNTQRFKTIRPYLHKFQRRYILTGSPATNSLLDLFGQVYVMDSGKTLGAYVTGFRTKFFFQTGFGGYDWKLKPGADEEIYAHLAPSVLRMSATDYLELPELVVEDIEVTLPPKAKAIYDQLEESLRLDFAEGKVLAENAAVAAMKCRQIANGGVYIEGGEHKHIHDAKIEAVGDLMEELEGQPALIAYEFKHDLERLRKLLGQNTPYIGGGVSGKAADRIVDAWNRGELRALLGHPKSMSHGLNMQEAGRAVIWHSLPWSLEEYDQFIRRIWRQGQKGRVFVYRIIAKDTIDEAVVKALSRKNKTQNALFAALKEYWGL